MSSLLASLLALIFGWAALAKVFGFRAWAAALESYALADPLRRTARFSVPVLEAAVAGLLLFGAVRAGAALAGALALAFCIAILRVRRISGRRRLRCGCFGGNGERDYRGMLAIDLSLAAVAAAVLVAGEAPADVELDQAVPTALAAVGIALAAWVVRQVVEAARG